MPGPKNSRRARRVWPQDPIRASHPLNQGRLAWWLCLPETMGGNTLYDLCGLYHGTLASMTGANDGWRPATRPGGWGSLSFDGSGAVVDLAGSLVKNNTALPTANFAAAAWATPSGFSTFGMVLSLGSDVNNTGGWGFSFGFGNTGGGSGANITGLYPAVSWIAGTTNNAAVAGQWYRIAMVGHGGNCYIGVNGQIVSTTTSVTPNSFDPTYVQATLGGQYSMASRRFAGSIDDATIWSGSPLALASPASFVAMDYDQSIRGYPDALNWY